MGTEETFDLAAAGLRADGGELALSVEALASKLEGALPGRTRVERRGEGLLGRGPKHVRRLDVELAQGSYRLAVEDERVRCTRERQVGGISIKREALAPQQWIAALSEDLREQAQQSAEARAALERLLD